MKRKKQARKYIDKYFSLDKTNFNRYTGMIVDGGYIHTPYDFCHYVNSRPWKKGESLFKTIYIPWNKTKNTYFSFAFKKRRNKCRVNDNYPVHKFQSQYN